MRGFSEADLWGLVCRADTLDKVATAEAFINRLAFSSKMQEEDLPGALLEALGLIREELEDREMYSPSCPWNAPGMRAQQYEIYYSEKLLQAIYK